MKIRPLHPWNLSPREAVALQRKLAKRVDTTTTLERCELVAGADASYGRFSNVFYAGVVVIRVSDGRIVETQAAVRTSPFPYIPGLLTFREAPVLLDAFAKVESEPDVVMIDGHGNAHPRRIGIAAHMGLWLDRPCLGCAKSLLIGTYRMPRLRAGSTSALMDGDEILGEVVRTKNGVKPVFVSTGHQIDLASAVRVVLASCRGYRLPEPTRLAHLHVNEFRRSAP